jgi:phosphate transport system permease protein
MTFREIKDKAMGGTMAFLTWLCILPALAICIGLLLKSTPILSEHSLWTLLSSSEWKPVKGEFGFLPFITGTLGVTLVAIIFAFPISLLSSVFLTEYARPRLKKYVFPFLDILAALPSVIYGVWGTLLIVPWVSEYVAPHFVDFSSGYTMLAGGIVLGVMILPLLTSLLMEIFATVPDDFRIASLSLGATKWQTAKRVIFRKTAPGIIAATVLSISRAMGETIAVLMVCGNVPKVPDSLLDACYPLPALIANNYGEMLSMPNYEAALMFAALLLFVVVLVFNLFSRIILRKMEVS